MTGRPLDPEQEIRDWLVGSLPDRAPSSLRETLDEVTSRPAGSARAWPRDASRSVRLASRVAAVVVIMAVAGAGAYFYGTRRPGTAEVATPTRTATPANTASPSHQASSSPSQVQLVGDWHLVDTQFKDDQPFAFMSGHLTQTISLSSGGFLAFVYNDTSKTTSVFRSSDGTAWDEVGRLPTKTAAVAMAAESAGRIVAAGYEYDAAANLASPVAWTTTDLKTWQAAVLPAPPDTGADMIVAGPTGFFACGHGLQGSSVGSSFFWVSANGISWRAVAATIVPAGGQVEDLSANSAGYVMRTTDTDGRIRSWQSVDGVSWKEAWSGPANSGPEFSTIEKPTYKAPSGGYVTFGVTVVGTSGTSWYQVMWKSGDLTHWTIAGRVEASGGQIQNFDSIPGGYIGVGYLCQSGSQCSADGPDVWTSADGQSWQPVAGISKIDGLQTLSASGVVSDGMHVIVVLIDNSDQIHLLVGTELK